VAVLSPAGALEREFRYAERIGGGAAALTPWGELAVVSWDPKAAGVSLFDAATGQRRAFFECADCSGVPAIDGDGVIYLDGGARAHVIGFDLVSGRERYRLDRTTLWRSPHRPASTFALAEGEVVFVELGADGVTLVRAGGG
jgi:hypothetical protein